MVAYELECLRGQPSLECQALSGKSGVEGAMNYPLPAGFFNEPFHDKEWSSEWNRTDNQSLFVHSSKKT